ncbi:hypothetical protein AVEN_103257-1 [Araneus ventricosus]|uniref:Uncharacterized protein n=1 Tax=Araneus ventricosus TaxID=182803 RepID=A0A4Y2R6V9_ARAVE|nr:hypothetical protein AVEN_103257-1 [Araneus ventricosus]
MKRSVGLHIYSSVCVSFHCRNRVEGISHFTSTEHEPTWVALDFLFRLGCSLYQYVHHQRDSNPDVLVVPSLVAESMLLISRVLVTFSYTKNTKRKYCNRQKIRTRDFDESPRFRPP